MREILFRGKTKQGEWIVGDLSDGKYITGWFMGEIECISITPETVGQFTGLTDKNGVKIFEGDIVDHYAFSGSVVFENGMFSSNSSANINFCECKQPLAYHDTKKMEVIGNIHDGEVQ